MDYLLKRWPAFTRFLDDGRICLTNNAADERCAVIAMTRSLYPSSSSIWKHWELAFRQDATRATCPFDRGRDPLIVEVGEADLVRSARDNLLGLGGGLLDQATDAVARDARASTRPQTSSAIHRSSRRIGRHGCRARAAVSRHGARSRSFPDPWACPSGSATRRCLRPTTGSPCSASRPGPPRGYGSHARRTSVCGPAIANVGRLANGSSGRPHAPPRRHRQ